MSEAPRASILNYNLFGETGDLPDVVHCETIETRSRLHDWELAPHRHARLHQILLLESGGGRVSLDGQGHTLGPSSLVNVPIGLVHSFTFTPGTVGLVVTLAAEMLDVALQPSEGLRPVLAQPAVLPAEAAHNRTMTEIAETFAGRDFARAHMLRSLSALILGQIARTLDEAGRAGTSASAPDLLTRFEALLEAHYLQHWPVADYADALAVSPTHLSRVCRVATGRPATRLIEERVVREARRNLVYTGLTVSTIAYALGYADPAYFSRVFSRATGLAPREFRARALREGGA
ncbi:MAG: helix-turn-helix domain-containing protein [Alphaproteobacteria bacterium]